MSVQRSLRSKIELLKINQTWGKKRKKKVTRISKGYLAKAV